MLKRDKRSRFENSREAVPYFCEFDRRMGSYRVEKDLKVGHCRAVKPKRVRLYIKPYCGWCHKAIRWLDERGVDFEEVDVISDEAAYDEMIRISGQELAPVIDVDGEVLADFGPDQLERFWQKLETRHAGSESR